MSLRGYCRTERERIACSPAIRITRLTTIARTGRRTKRSVIFMSVVLRFRGRIVRGLHRVVDLDGGAGPELEGSGRHDLLAGLEAREHRDLVPARGTELDELLPRTAVREAL